VRRKKGEEEKIKIFRFWILILSAPCGAASLHNQDYLLQIFPKGISTHLEGNKAVRTLQVSLLILMILTCRIQMINKVVLQLVAVALLLCVLLQSFSNEESESISASNSNLEGTNGNHNIDSINANMTSSSTDNENSHHHLLFENMQQEEYDLHKHTQGTARFNKEQTACIELAHILDKCDAPKIVFDQIIAWAVEHCKHLSNNPPSRQKFYSKLEKTLSFNKHLPEKIVVVLSGNKASKVTRHDPGSSIFSLLTSNDLPTGETHSFLRLEVIHAMT